MITVNNILNITMSYNEVVKRLRPKIESLNYKFDQLGVKLVVGANEDIIVNVTNLKLLKELTAHKLLEKNLDGELKKISDSETL